MPFTAAERELKFRQFIKLRAQLTAEGRRKEEIRHEIEAIVGKCHTIKNDNIINTFC